MSNLYRVFLIGVLLIVALLHVAGIAQATLVSVNNPSFENQILENGTIDTAITGWTYWSSADGSGLVCNPTGYDGGDADTAYGFLGASGNGTPLGADGANVLWEYEFGSQYGMFQQVLDTTLQEGCTYTLTAAVGMVPTDGNLNAQLLLSTEGVPGSLTGLLTYSPLIAPGSMTAAQFVDVSLIYTPSAADIATYGGQKLMIGLCGAADVGVTGRIAFDNVRMDVVPEPCTLTLLASGVLGLFAYGWRKRR